LCANEGGNLKKVHGGSRKYERLARMASVLVGDVGSHHQLQKAWSGVNDMNKCKKVTEEEEETKVKGGDKMDVAKLLQQHVDLMDDMFKEV
jgi:hypothetical protein